MTTAFLSHKKRNEPAAKALVDALSIVVPRDEIFLAEEIDKGDNWRSEIEQALTNAKCFILLYTDPQLDWSWCFYEAGVFANMQDRQGRPIFCLHPSNIEPPSPLANLQTIKATPGDLESWIRNDLCDVVGCRQPNGEVIGASITKIVKLISDTSPLREMVLKPFIWIEPSWPGPGEVRNWNDADALSRVDFSTATVSIDAASATQLGFASPPTGEQLLPFLRELACDAQWSNDRLEFWIAKFFESLREATKGRLLFQEAAYFRHESGRILRPVVVTYTKNPSGTMCRLRVIFASAFGSPLTDNPSLEQRLFDGIQLAVRTRLEVIDQFRNRMSQLYREKILSQGPRDAIARSNPIGGRVVEALDAISQEASAHGMRPGDAPPRLFEEPEHQHKYEEVRSRGLAVWEELTTKACEEDRTRTGEYPESERLLGELDKCVQDYLDLSLPRLQELLTRGHQ